MDWSNEEYVRLYTRETADDLELSWEAIALWRAMLTKFDRAGVITVRNGWPSIARLTRMPVDVVERAGRELVSDGRVCETGHGFVAPNFVEAQTASKSDRVRQKDSRDRRRSFAMSSTLQNVTIRDVVSQNVTPGHELSHAVTSGHKRSRNVTLTSADPMLASAEAMLIPRDAHATKPKRTATRKSQLPPDWTPRPEERAKASENGLSCDAEVPKFRDHHTAKGSLMADWDAAFRTWLRNAVQFRSGGQGGPRQGSLNVGRVEPHKPHEYEDGEVAF